MNAKQKAQGKTTDKESTISYKEVDFYRDRFAEWLTAKAGKEARGAFFALWAIEIFSRVNISTFDREVARARRTLQRFLHQIYKPEN
jgi:hypothetical protein